MHLLMGEESDLNLMTVKLRQLGQSHFLLMLQTDVHDAALGFNF
jgi:hypothetical protein